MSFVVENQNTEAWEQLILLKTDDDKIIIQSRWNNRNLQVQESGKCVFANHNKGLSRLRNLVLFKLMQKKDVGFTAL